MGQFLFGNDMIIPIEYNTDLELIHQQKNVQTNKYNIRKNKNILGYG